MSNKYSSNYNYNQNEDKSKKEDDNHDEDILSNVFQNTSFIKERDTNFKKEEIRLKQYKSTNSNQQHHEKRIKYFLDRQKEKRRSLLSHVRTLISNNSNSNSNNEEEADMEMNETSASTTETNNIDSNNENANKKNKFKEINKKKQQNKANKQDTLYSNHLMIAEGMVHIPNNLENEWYFVPVPLGYRCLVISQNDNTTVRCSETGLILKKFKSQFLPFGSEKSREHGIPPQNQYCILDCIYQDTTNTFYILDILSWKGYILYDCDTEFRFFWRDSKLLESQFLQEKQPQQQEEYKFKSLPYFSPTVNSLEEVKSSTTQYKTEFLLFYHKASHYEFGTTPLFCSLSIEYIDNVIQVLNYRDQYGIEDEENDDNNEGEEIEDGYKYEVESDNNEEDGSDMK